MNLNNLRKIAEAATPGKWPDYNDPNIREQLWNYYDWDKDRKLRVPVALPPSDSEYIATFNPALVSKLLDVVEAAKGLRNKRRFDCQIVEANDWVKMQEALKALEAEVDKQK